MSKIDRQIAKLNKKIEEAKKRGEYIQAMQFAQEREKLISLQLMPTKVTLKDALYEHTREERMEMTTQIIIAISIADILVSATMDIEEKFRQFGIIGVPMMEEK